MQIVRSFGPSVDALCARSPRAPTIDELRPSFCPQCGQPKRRPAGQLAIVGHGFYRRQLLGLDELRGDEISVRRFRCCACGGTTSILPDLCHPYRWYAAVVILQALWRHLLLGETAREVSIRFGRKASSSWRSLRRWGLQLLGSATLWGWLGRSLGVREGTSPRVRSARMIAQRTLDPAHDPDEQIVAEAARIPLTDLTYARDHEPVPLRVLPGLLASQTSACSGLGEYTQEDRCPVRPP